MKKNLPFWQKCLAVVAVLAAVYLWYTRPMTLDRICPSFAWADTTHVSGYEEIGDMDAPSPIVSSDTFTIGEPQAQEIYQRVLTSKFRRDPLASLMALLRGYSIVYFGEADGIPTLSFFAPEQRMNLELTEDGHGKLTSHSVVIYLTCSDKTLFQDALDFLRAHPFDNTPKMAA